MAGEEETFNSQLKQTQTAWKKDLERGQSQVDELQTKLSEASNTHESGKDSQKEVNLLWRRVKTTTTLLTYLESKARFVDKVNLPVFDSREVETLIAVDEQDGSYMGEILNSVKTVSDVMEILIKRVRVAESETTDAKRKVSTGQEEIKRKAIEIETMSEKLDEMDGFAMKTNCILNEMKQRVEDLVEETSRQRQRAAENEQELTRVKQDFESLKSYISSLISVRETLVSSEKQFQTIERLFERLVVKTTQLESENVQKEAQVHKLMDENMKLSALLDKKEAQLLAMNEQCKVMALSASNI
ncbi:uncharacterized protein LOC143532083 [Bidens hawaiensis]|uniref:uncharacterized protein LOC143532083 n=1 Tax=Bidens hawaiensis TaxID=980011 RepID=UPI0040499F5A